MTYPARTAYRNSEAAGTYDQRRFSSLKGRLTDLLEKRIITAMVRRLSSREGLRILDVPCGTGRMETILAEGRAWIVGADLSIEMLTRAAGKAAGTAGRAVFLAGDAERLPFLDDTFDIVLCHRLFGHLPPENRVHALKEFRRVSRSGVIVSYYHRLSMQHLLRRGRRKRAGIPWHGVTRPDIEMELSRASLKQIGMKYLFPGVSETIAVVAEK